jgi:hypothetical protein
MKESTAPPSTCFWKIDFNMLKEASEIRKRDPKEFRGAVLTFFAFGGSDDGTIVQKMRAHPAGSLILKERIPLPAGITKPELFRDLPEGSLGPHRGGRSTPAPPHGAEQGLGQPDVGVHHRGKYAGGGGF